MKKIEIEYPTITYKTLIMDIDKLIDTCIKELKFENVESITEDAVIDEFVNNTDYYLEKYGLNEFDYVESAWSQIIDEAVDAFSDRIYELEELPL